MLLETARASGATVEGSSRVCEWEEGSSRVCECEEGSSRVPRKAAAARCAAASDRPPRALVAPKRSTIAASMAGRCSVSGAGSPSDNAVSNAVAVHARAAASAAVALAARSVAPEGSCACEEPERACECEAPEGSEASAAPFKRACSMRPSKLGSLAIRCISCVAAVPSGVG